MRKLVLHVEDDEHDVLFLQIAFEEAKIPNPVAVARDGREALAYLKGEGKYSNRQRHPLPGLVLLDLRLPYVPGHQVLKWIRGQPEMAALPVIICSSSAEAKDVNACYALGANGYIVKPSSPRELAEVARHLKKYWLDMEGPPANCTEWQSINVGPQSSANP